MQKSGEIRRRRLWSDSEVGNPRPDDRSLPLVSAGVDLAGHQHGRTGGALARSVREGIQDAGYGGVGGENAYQYNRDGGESNDESNQQRAQVRPTFSLSPGNPFRNPFRATPFLGDQSLYSR